MFFDPIWLYLKGLAVTLIVEVGLFTLIISKKPLQITAAAFFNITSHLLLHLFFQGMLLIGFGYNFYAWLIGEVLVLLLESALFFFSRIIPSYRKALFWALVFNLSSIAIGHFINLLLF
ncbi:MAG: hypothetical protein HN948_08795 [Clostridia bacterium]|jgi:hypothetical protein|nr:hypothetical protein [Clostridia bacterium]MBT7123087.1 hypothetical protein [Clostridia bacterium]